MLDQAFDPQSLSNKASMAFRVSDTPDRRRKPAEAPATAIDGAGASTLGD